MWGKHPACDDLVLESLTVQTALKGTTAPWGEIFCRAEWRCNRKPASRTVTPLQFISYLLPTPTTESANGSTGARIIKDGSVSAKR